MLGFRAWPEAELFQHVLRFGGSRWRGPALRKRRCRKDTARPPLIPCVAEKYFGCDASREPLKAKVAKAICARCVVLDECCEEGLKTRQLPTRGIIAGVAIGEITPARAWRDHELGLRDIPRKVRPDWLTMTDATNTVEQGRVEDELGVET